MLFSSPGSPPKKTHFLRCGEYTLNLGGRTHIMGVLNITPDSFSDGGKFLEPLHALKHAVKMVEDGADIIDIGAESSRPGAAPVDCQDELERLLPVLRLLVRELSVPISVDTYKAQVARVVLDLGVHIINDISGLSFDAQMAPLIAGYDAAVIIMHMRGSPRNMQNNPQYGSLMAEISSFLRKQIGLAVAQGIGAGRIVIDPGIGFGKTVEHNLQIIKHLEDLKKFDKPILLGTSRKSFIGKVLELPVDRREEGTAATLTCGIMQGAQIVRVHDVYNMSKVVRMTDAIMGAD